MKIAASLPVRVSRPHSHVAKLPLLILLCAALTVQLGAPSFADVPVPGHGLIANEGQIDPRVRYYFQGSGVRYYFTPQGVMVDLPEESLAAPPETARGAHLSMERGRAPTPPQQTRRGHAVWIRFQGANPSPQIDPGERLSTHYSFFHGSDPTKWHASVPVYSSIRYRQVWPGVDVIYRLEGDTVRYKFELVSNTNPLSPRFEYDGTANATLQDGTVRMETRAGAFADTPPRGQEWGKLFRMGTSLAGTRDGLTSPESAEPLATSSPSEPPNMRLLWSTYLVGSGYQSMPRIALDGTGNPVVAGVTGLPTFPTTPGAYDTTYKGLLDIFVAKLSVDGSSLLWSTFIGGGEQVCNSPTDCFPPQNVITGIALDGVGNPVIAGYTAAPDFPTTPSAYSHDCGIPTEVSYSAVVAKLSPDGSSLLSSTCIGRGVFAMAVALDGAGNPVIAGYGNIGTYPSTSGAYMPCNSAPGTFVGAFVTKLTVDASDLIWSTCTDPSIDTLSRPHRVAVDSPGNVVVVGDYGVVLKLDPAGHSVLWRNMDPFNNGCSSGPSGVALDGAGNPVIVYCGSVAKLDVGDGHTIWNKDLGFLTYDVALDGAGSPVVVGQAGPGLPTVDAFDSSYNQDPDPEGSGIWDAFLAKLSPDGRVVIWSTYFGGIGSDGQDINVALDGAGRPIVVGKTLSDYTSGFPVTSGSYDTTYLPGTITLFVSSFAGPTTCIQHDGSMGPLINMQPGHQGACVMPLGTSAVTGFDVIRGALESLSSTSIGPVTALACNSPTSVFEDDQKPERGFFYLIRNSPGGSYTDGAGPGLVGGRTPSSGDCP